MLVLPDASTEPPIDDTTLGLLCATVFPVREALRSRIHPIGLINKRS